jgi:carbamoyltransferase
MLLVADVAEDQRLPVPDGPRALWGIDLLKVRRSTIPAVTHIDYSARIQTVDAERHGLFHSVMRRFYELTGCPVIVNTSFNVRGEPIVCTPADAYRCFRCTHIDALALGRRLLLKSGQTDARAASRYLEEFQLD